MKLLWLMVLAVLVVGSSASIMGKKSHKKMTSKAEKKHLEDIERKLEGIKELEAELERELEAAEEEDEEDENEGIDEAIDEVMDEAVQQYWPMMQDEPQEYVGDLCADMFCGAGRYCIITDAGEAECACVNACEEETDARRRVCSNFNETWMSDCELYRQRCLCEEGDPSCLKPDNKHTHIEYYGECQEKPQCADEELEDFPRRMSEWLFHIMRDMADRETLSEHYIRLEREAEQDPKKQWSYAVVWKWCDLDSHPKDKSVSRHELFPIRAPLYTLENCVATFLDSCDANGDHNITLREWANCTRLTDEDLGKFETFCEDLREE